jgi:hypothetical protein
MSARNARRAKKKRDRSSAHYEHDDTVTQSALPGPSRNGDMVGSLDSK